MKCPRCGEDDILGPVCSCGMGPLADYPPPPLEPDELDRIANEMEYPACGSDGPKPDDAAIVYRAADEVRRLRAALANVDEERKKIDATIAEFLWHGADDSPDGRWPCGMNVADAFARWLEVTEKENYNLKMDAIGHGMELRIAKESEERLRSALATLAEGDPASVLQGAADWIEDRASQDDHTDEIALPRDLRAVADAIERASDAAQPVKGV